MQTLILTSTLVCYPIGCLIYLCRWGSVMQKHSSLNQAQVGAHHTSKQGRWRWHTRRYQEYEVVDAEGVLEAGGRATGRLLPSWSCSRSWSWIPHPCHQLTFQKCPQTTCPRGFTSTLLAPPSLSTETSLSPLASCSKSGSEMHFSSWLELLH